MKTTKLLNNILAMLRSVKEDRTKLLKLYELMVNEIYEEVKEEEPDIPEKYRNVTREAAEWVDAGMVCYINPITLDWSVSLPMYWMKSNGKKKTTLTTMPLSGRT